MKKVLIAEDEHDIRELLKLTLSFGGYTVTAARDGQEAVEMASQDEFDLIIMDVRMPRMTGYEACRALKDRSEFDQTPIILLSAKGQKREIEEGVAVGANAYILKPFAPDQLLKKIGEVLAA